MNVNVGRALSQDEIINYLDGKIRVIIYTDLGKYKSINELLYPYDGCIILYKTSNDFGHWTLLLRNRWGIEFFDPYGVPIDDQIKFIIDNYREIKNQLYPHLTALILNSGYKYIISNKVQLQKKSVSIQTCGRWCIFRYINRFSDLRSFIKLFDGYELGKKDKIVTELVELDDEIIK